MVTDRFPTSGTMTRRLAVAVFVAGVLTAGAPSPLRLDAAQAAPPGLRLYVFDCGYLINLSPETYNLTRQDVPDPTMSVSCFLVVHPGGSRKDAEVIAAANEHGMALVFTDHRHFRH